MRSLPGCEIRHSVVAARFRARKRHAARLEILLRVPKMTQLSIAQRLDRDFFMRRNKLDKIDRRILSDLQADGRMTNVELAQNAGISAPPCLRRVRALEEAGLIRGYHAEINPEALGFGVTVFAQVGLATQAEPDLKAFEALVASWHEVREAHMLAGETDFLLKIVASDWDSYQRFLTTKLTAAPNVTHVKSSLAIRASKYEPGVPIDVDAKE
jgi:DNA-binding Lrp family transcriptional regulator